jgi:cytochrome oxidase complex assembly protein 1
MGIPPSTPVPMHVAPAPPNWWSRNWKWFVPVGCLTLIVLFAAFVGGIVFTVAGAMKSSDAYKLAMAKAQSNPLVQQRLGTPIAAGMFVSGSVNVAGTSGKADITIPISGPKGKGTIYVDATKFAGEWKFNRLEVGIDGEEQRIDLLQPVVRDQ